MSIRVFARCCAACATSAVAMSFMVNSAAPQEQSAPRGEGVTLPPITVVTSQAPKRKLKRTAARPAARAAATSSQPARANAPAASVTSPGTIDMQDENAWGSVDGFVASRSATGTKTDTPLIEVPQSISVVTRDQMQTRQVQSLNETLKYTAGVFAEGSGYQPSNPVFSIRGHFANPGTGAVFLNGLRTINDGDIEPYGLERVEVMRGPASVLYGQGQPGGVIGLVTKRPIETPMHEVQLQRGSFEQRSGAFDFGGPVTEDRTLLYRFTGLLREGGNGIDFSYDERAFLSGALTWRPTAETEITAFGLHQRSYDRFNYGLPAYGTALGNPNGRIPVTRFIGELAFGYSNREMTAVGYNLQHRATDSLVFRQNLQYSHQIWNSPNNIVPRSFRADLRTLDRWGSREYSSWDTFGIDSQAELKTTTGLLRHTVLFGVDYLSRKYSVTGTYDGVVGPLDVFLQFTVRLFFFRLTILDLGKPKALPASTFRTRSGLTAGF